MGAINRRGKIYYIDVRIYVRRIRKRIGTSKKMTELVLKDIEVKAVRKVF